MASDSQKFLKLLFRLLGPIVRLLIEKGVSHRTFAELAKRAYVQQATEHYGIRGRPTNVSRVAVMTGLTRKEVKRVRDTLGAGSEIDDLDKTLAPGETVLAGWHNDPRFLDSNGVPRDLPFNNEFSSTTDKAATFADLIRQYAGDIPPGAIRTELKRNGSVVERQKGFLSVARRTAVESVTSKETSELMEGGLYALAERALQSQLNTSPFASRREKDREPTRLFFGESDIESDEKALLKIVALNEDNDRRIEQLIAERSVPFNGISHEDSNRVLPLRAGWYVIARPD